jgi:hypothetical protein
MHVHLVVSARRGIQCHGGGLVSLTRPALIGRLSQRDDTTWLAELLIEIETDPEDLTRPRLIDELQQALD